MTERFAHDSQRTDAHPLVRATALAALAGLTALAAPRAAAAQTLVPAGDEASSMYLAFPTFTEAGALFAYGLDGANAVLLRVDAGSVQRQPRAPWSGGANVGPVEMAPCGGQRWLLEYDSSRQRFALRPEGGAEVWFHAFAPGAFARVALRCAGTRPVVGWVEGGELVTAALQPSIERRTRLWAAGAGEVVWTARAPDEVFAVFRPMEPAATTTLVRIANGAVTDRRDLGAASEPVIALSGDRVLVGWSTGTPPGVTFQSFAAASLSPAIAASVRLSDTQHGVTVRGLWPLAGGGVVVGYQEHWQGPDLLRSPHGPTRDEPAPHGASALQVWTPAAARIGPRFEIGSDDVGEGAVLGAQFVLLQGGHAGGVRVRRFRVGH